MFEQLCMSQSSVLDVCRFEIFTYFVFSRKYKKTSHVKYVFFKLVEDNFFQVLSKAIITIKI